MPAISPEGLAKAMSLCPMGVAELAKAVGVSEGYIVHILKGRRSVERNPRLRQHIARTLGVPQHWIETPETGAA